MFTDKMSLKRIHVEDLSLLLRALHKFWFIRLPLTGRSIILGGIFLTYAGMITCTGGDRSLWLFWLLLTTASLAIFFGFIFKPRVEVSRRLPDGVTAGREFSIQMVVRNKTSQNFYDISFVHNLPRSIEVITHPHVNELKQRTEKDFIHTLRATSRGVYHLKNLYALSTFPFGVWNGIKNIYTPHRLTVYPAFTPLETFDIPVGLRYQPGGVALTSNIGESNEFLSIREYRAGDNPRHIHAPSWARRGEPVVKVFQEEYFCRIAVVLDTHVPTGSEEPLEAAVSLAASVADFLANKEYIVDLFAAGPDLYFLESGRSLAYLKNILEILASVDACKSSPFGTLGPAVAEYLSRTTTIILILLDWDSERASFVRFCQESGTAVKVLVVRDHNPSHPLPDFVSTFTSEEASRVINL